MKMIEELTTLSSRFEEISEKTSDLTEQIMKIWGDTEPVISETNA